MRQRANSHDLIRRGVLSDEADEGIRQAALKKGRTSAHAPEVDALGGNRRAASGDPILSFELTRQVPFPDALDAETKAEAAELPSVIGWLLALNRRVASHMDEVSDGNLRRRPPADRLKNRNTDQRRLPLLESEEREIPSLVFPDDSPRWRTRGTTNLEEHPLTVRSAVEPRLDHVPSGPKIGLPLQAKNEAASITDAASGARRRANKNGCSVPEHEPADGVPSRHDAKLVDARKVPESITHGRPISSPLLTSQTPEAKRPNSAARFSASDGMSCWAPRWPHSARWTCCELSVDSASTITGPVWDIV